MPAATATPMPEPLPHPSRPGRALVVLPTFNEAGNIAALCEQILQADPRVDVVVVDDQSPDGTAGQAQRLQRQWGERLRVEVRARRQGRGDAVQHGFDLARAAGYEFVIEMDADFSHEPGAVPRLLDAAREADVVIGSRHLPGGGFEGWNWRRSLVHWLASRFADLVLGTPTTDHTNGFRCYRVARLPVAPMSAEVARGFAGQTLRAYVLHRAGLRFAEVPVMFRERRTGTSKMSLREAVSGALAMIRYRLRQWDS